MAAITRGQAMTIEQQAKDFTASRTWCPEDNAVELAQFKASIGTPYCIECHDWHDANEEHSMSEDAL